MFGRKQKLEKLKAACVVVRKQLAGDDIDALVSARRDLIEAWRGVITDTEGATGLIGDAERRIDVLKRRQYEGTLRPCRHCEGREFRISHERELEQFGRVRLIVCVTCGLTQVFWADLKNLDSSGLFSQAFHVPTSPGPFR